MDCIFCKKKGTVKIVKNFAWEIGRTYRAKCSFCGAQGQSHDTAEAAEQEWQALIKKIPAASSAIEKLSAMVLQQVIDEGRATQVIDDIGRYKEALRDILHGPCAAPGWTEQKHRRLLEQTAHDALYGADDTEHVGNWKAMEGKETCIVCGRFLPNIGFEDGVCVDCTH